MAWGWCMQISIHYLVFGSLGVEWMGWDGMGWKYIYMKCIYPHIYKPIYLYIGLATGCFSNKGGKEVSN